MNEIEETLLLQSLYKELAYIKYEKLSLQNLPSLKSEVKERLQKILKGEGGDAKP